MLHGRNKKRLHDALRCGTESRRRAWLQKDCNLHARKRERREPARVNWVLDCEKCGKPSWDGPRYRDRHKIEQLSLFPKKTPPAEYKQRWVRIL